MQNKKQYRIAVMTHWWSQGNYGQILQAYALQKYLRTLGHDVYIVKYLQKRCLKKYFKVFKLKTWKDGLLLFKKKYKDKKHPRYFDSFKNKHLKFSDLTYSTFTELKHNPPEADIFIVGSDQVWGPWFHLEPYFLSFISDQSTKKIAYSASFGRELLTSEEITSYSKQITEFVAVGVREQSAVELCKQLGFHNAKCVPDPTILLNKEEWLRISQPSNYFKSDSTRVFVYIIGNDNNSKIYKTVEFLSQNLNTLYVSDENDVRSNAFPTIEKWIDLVLKADFIVTNSFHGTVFCLLFNKQFITMTREGVSSSMNVRLKAVLSKVGLDDHLLDTYNSNEIERLKFKAINWLRVDQILEDWKLEGINFLTKAIK